MSDPKYQPKLKEKPPPKRARETTLPLQSEESAQHPSSSHSLSEESTQHPSSPRSLSEESAQHPSSPHSLPEETMSDSSPSLRREYDNIKLLEAVAKFRFRNGILPIRPAIIPEFLNEVKDFVPLGLSEAGLIGKLYKERKNFLQKPSPGPDCPGFDRYLYELELKAFGLPSLCRSFKHNVSGSVKRGRKADVTKKRRKGAKKRKGVQNDSESSPSEAF